MQKTFPYNDIPIWNPKFHTINWMDIANFLASCETKESNKKPIQQNIGVRHALSIFHYWDDNISDKSCEYN